MLNANKKGVAVVEMTVEPGISQTNQGRKGKITPNPTDITDMGVDRAIHILMGSLIDRFESNTMPKL